MKILPFPLRAVLVGLVLIGCALGSASSTHPAQQPIPTHRSQPGQPIALAPPAFIGVAHAGALALDESGFLLKEAGISAYAQISRTLSLATLRPLFRVIEHETDDYLIGILSPPGYQRLRELGETMDVHAYVRKDGWLVAYLLAGMPTAKIIDWVNYDTQKLSASTLEQTVALLAERVGVARPIIAHYHFQYPTASGLTLVADREDRALSRDNFLIKLPTGLAIFERSWSSATTFFSICRVQQKELGRMAGVLDVWKTQSGLLDPQDLPVDKLTEFSIYNESPKARCYCGLAILHSGVG